MQSTITRRDQYRLFSSRQRLALGSRYLAIGLFALSQLFVNSSHAASRVFFDDFESGTTNAWDIDDFHVKAVAVTTAADGGKAHSGKYFASTNFDGTVAWNNPNTYTSFKLSSWPYSKEFFIRMWWRLDNDFGTNCGGCTAPGDGAKLARLNLDGTTQNNFTTQLAGGTTHEMWLQNLNYFINDWNGDYGALLNHQWHKVEIYVYQDPVNGVVKRWQDEVLTYRFTGRNTNNTLTPYYPLYLPSNWSSNPGWQHSASNHFYIDDVEIYSDVGSGAIGSMADATINVSGTISAPATPVSLSPPQNLVLVP